MKVFKKIPRIFYKIRKLLAKNQYEDINNLLTQDKYSELFQYIYQLDGKQVQQLVDQIMLEVLENTQSQLKVVFKGKNSDDQIRLIQFQKILRDQLVQIHFISVLFYQFDELVFKGFHQMSLQQYCLKKILDSSQGKFTKQIVNQIVQDLNKRKQLQDKNERFNTDLLQIINFFSCRTFLNQLYLEKQSYDFKISVCFNCEFTEEEAAKLIRYQEIVNKQEEKWKLITSDYSCDEEQIESNSQTSSEYLIEEQYIQKLIQDSEEFIDRIKDENLEDQISQIEEYIFREQQFISYYMNRISIKVSDQMQKICIYQNYPKLIYHKKHGLDQIFNNQNYQVLKMLYNFVQNDSESIKVLSQAFNQVVESKIQQAEKDQTSMFQEYKNEQQNQTENQMKSFESKNENLEKDISFIQICQAKWIQSIYNIYLTYYQNGLVQAFDNNPTLNSSLSRAFEQQFNMSELAVDYLVNSCHQYLLNEKFKQSHLELKEEEFENFISKIFCFICQKDQFLEVYRKLLSRRLIYKQSQGEKQELKYIEYFEKSVGLITQIDYMKQMIQDLNKSDLIKFDYYEQLNKIAKDQQEQKSKNSHSQRSRSRSRSRSIESRSEKKQKIKNTGILIESDSELQIISENVGDLKNKNNKQNKRSSNTQLEQVLVDDSVEIEGIEQLDNSLSIGFIVLENSQGYQEKRQMKSNSNFGKSGTNQFIEIEDSDLDSEAGQENIPTKQKQKRSLEKKNLKIKGQKEDESEEEEKKNNSYEIKNQIVDVMILTNIKWPLKLPKNSSSQIILPKFLEKYYQEYSENFRQVFKKQRKLELLHCASYSIVQFKSDIKQEFGQCYQLQVSSYSMIILLCFNKNKSVSVQQLQEKTGISKKIINEKLNILTRQNILRLKEEEESEDLEAKYNTRNYEINTDFYAKTQELDIDSIPQEQFYSQQIFQNLRADAQAQKSQKQVTSDILHHRKIIINSYIVQIMKEKETLHKDELIKLVQQKIKACKQIFTITDYFIKDQIKVCVEEDYLRYSQKEEEQDTLLYIK
ncbi:hypothetical protein ABPG73_011666 [Tetrahymena malaccensis]